ncbi:MAG: hypothetical protein N3H31_04910 [Candidatus Nezhaarchaeota archaeon]|nr:hypothetical protein [Candidatus Nezhaarchaeota archaeon]
MKLRLLALRRRVWFKALSKLERALVDLTIRVVEKVRSKQLAEALASIVDKLAQWLVSRKSFKDRALEVGRKLALRMAMTALKLGSLNARKLIEDEGYAFYLGVSYLNTPKLYRL